MKTRLLSRKVRFKQRGEEFEKEVSERIQLLKFLRPMVDAISEIPLEQIKVSADKKYEINNKGGIISPDRHNYASLDGGFVKTFLVANKVLPKVSPELFEQYVLLLRDGKFKVNIEDKNQADTVNEGSRADIDVHIANNPASIEIIGHEVAHVITAGLNETPFRETGSIAAEVLTGEVLKEHGINDTSMTESRLGKLNEFCASEHIKLVYALIDMASEMNIDLLARQPIDALLEQYKEHPTANKKTLEIVDIFVKNGIESKNALAQHMHQARGCTEKFEPATEYGAAWSSMLLDKTQPEVHSYEIGTMLAPILVKKIKNNEFTLNDVFTALNNDELSYVECLAEFGITEITQDMINDVYKFAAARCKRFEQTKDQGNA